MRQTILRLWNSMRRQDAEARKAALRIGVLLGVFLLTVPVLSHAQINTGAIVGRLTDPSGAVVVNAKVTLENIATGIKDESNLTPTGDFAFRGLTPGMYKLTVVATGFNTFEETNIEVTVATTTNRDVHLTLGATTTAVTVNASAVAVQTASSTLGTVVGERQVRDLPLNGRNFTQLLVLTAGAASPGTTGIWGNPQAGDYRQPSINGQDTNSTGWVLDGTNNRSNFSGGISAAPVIDDIEEFKVVSHSDSVEYGGFLGGYVNVVTKSGTNQFHGAAWEFLRNDKLDARNPFKPNVNPLKQNQFGANLGGPFIRNKAFFFGSYQGFRQHVGSTALYRVPTPAMMAGDFTGENPIYNIFSTRPDPTNPGSYIRDPFKCDAAGIPIVPNADGTQTGGTACQKVPTSMLNPQALLYAKTLFPAPVNTGVPGTNGIDTAPQIQNQDFFSGRGDYQITPSHSVSVRVTHIDSPNISSGGIIGSSFLRESFGYNMGVNYTYTITPNTIFHLNFGRTWVNLHLSSKWNNLDYDSVVYPNWPWACGKSSGFGKHNCWAPLMAIPAFAQVNNFDAHVGQTNIWEATPNLDRIEGRHYLKFGFTFARHRIWATTQRAFEFFDYRQTADLNNLGSTGSGVASFFLGIPSGGEIDDTAPGTQQPSWTWGIYAQDQFKVSPKLTINYGLRWDLYNPGQYGTPGTTNYYSGHMDMLKGTYLIPADPGPCSTVGHAPCIPTGALPAHVLVAPNHKIFKKVWDNWAPRVGMAYRLKPNTVLRAGIGRYYDTWGNADVAVVQSEGLWPDSKAVASTLKNRIFFDPTATLANPLNITIGQAAQPDPNGPFDISGRQWMDPDIKNAFVDQWNAGVEQQLGSNTMMEVDYVGSRGMRIPVTPTLGAATVPGPGDPTLREIFPYIAPSPNTVDWGRNWYNALQATVRHNFSHGLSYSLAYTWSKSMDINGNQQPYNLLHAEKAVGGNDFTHVLAIGGVYQLPLGQTGSKLATSSRAVNTIIGGWQLNGILQGSSGTPYGVFFCGDIANLGRSDCYMRPNLVGNPSVSNPTLTGWFNTNAFATPAQYTYGNEGRNILRGDGLVNLDLSLFRDIPIHERFKLQFRFETFNSTNTVTWGNPVTQLGISGVTGHVYGTRSTERQLQFAMKLYF